MKNDGYIKEQVDDADTLIEQGRYKSALLLLLTAIDGSAKKKYPEGTKSISFPKDIMRNKERYKRFLGVRIRQVMGMHLSEDAYNYEKLPSFVDGVDSPEDIIYKQFRCDLVHEGKIEDEYYYVYDEDSLSQILKFQFSDGKIKFSSGFLRLLKDVIALAPVNASDFEFRDIRFEPRPGESFDELFDRISSRCDVSPGRIQILINILEEVGGESFKLDDAELAEKLTNILFKKHSAVEIRVICNARDYDPICSQVNGFTPNGIKLIREIIAQENIVSEK